MSNKNLVIDLKRRVDKDGRTFYVGKIKAPISIDCSEGAVFLIFTSDVNDEQIQIAPMDNKELDD
ncbi:MAG TPA: hypothetical protein VII94_00930 [Candidatus Saccharimonadales bacterium]